MQDLFKKLNFKDQQKILIMNEPKSFDPALAYIRETAILYKEINNHGSFDFIIAFVRNRQEIADLVPKIINTIKNDEILWFSYPKKSSKKYKADFNRAAVGRSFKIMALQE